MKSSNHFAQRIQSGVIAGLVMLLIGFLIGFLMAPLIPDGAAAMGIGMLMFCLIPFWLVAHGVLGVSLYIRSGSIASPKDGAQIGAASSIFLVIISLGFGILSDTLLYDPNSLVRGAAFGMGLSGAGTAAISSTFSGMIWALILKSKRPKSEGNSVQRRIVNPVTTSQPVIIVPSNKSPIVAGLLSLFLFGGVGQIYLGQWKKGLALIFASFFFGPLYLLIIPIGSSDAYGTAQKLKNGNPVGEWEFTITWKTFGWAVIATIIAVVVFVLIYSLGYFLVLYMQGTLRIPT